MKGTSEQLKRIFNDHNINCTFYTTTTLRTLLSHAKGAVPSEQRNNIVYKYDCRDGEAVYFGESKRPLAERTKEHTRAVRAADTRRYETADHCWKYNHDFDWENKKIMDYEANTTTRKIKETIHRRKRPKTNPEKAQLFAESVKRNFSIESHLFSKSQFDRINKFVEAHSYHFTPLNSPYDNITDTGDDSNLVADVDPDTLIRIVRTELKNGKAPGIDNVYNIILKKAIGTGFYKVLARAFTISLKLGFIPHVWKVTVLCMLIKPDKPPSQTTSYRPISLLSAMEYQEGIWNFRPKGDGRSGP